MDKRVLIVLAGWFCGAALAADGKATYDQVCAKCHRSGIDGAPKLSDKLEWSKRLSAGKTVMLKSVIDGKGEMPARAGKEALTDDDAVAAIEYIEKQVR
jgi:cytochrome c5